jgi:hypothetical protein
VAPPGSIWNSHPGFHGGFTVGLTHLPMDRGINVKDAFIRIDGLFLIEMFVCNLNYEIN